MDDLSEKVEELLKSLLSLKQPMKQDAFVPSIKPLSIPKPSIKQPTGSKIPSGLPPPSKKDPTKVAEQLKNPRPGKVTTEVLKVEDNGQWSLNKVAAPTKLDKPLATTAPSPQPPNPNGSTQVSGTLPPARAARLQALKAPINAETEGFANHHSPEQKKLIHGLDIHSSKPMSGGIAGAAHKATNSETKQNVILKAASGHANQKERGHLDNGFNSAKREVLFHNMARDFFGLGKHVPTTAGFSRGGEDYSAQEFKPNAQHADLKRKPEQDLDLASGENPFNSAPKVDEFANPNHAKVLGKLHDNGTIHKLAMMDNMMGHHDRHGGNYMLDDKENNMHLIDNGTAFDYKNFDQYHYPGYMTTSTNPRIKGMGGRDNKTVHPAAAKWLKSLDPEKAKEILATHGHDENSPTTQGFLRRLQGLKSSVANGPKHYEDMENLLGNNRLTSGPMHEHEEEEKKW